MVAVPVATLPPFTATVEHVRPADLPFSWRPGCPVAPSQLRRIQLQYVGFDGRPRTGEIVVNAAVVGAVTGIFKRLYAERFPIRRIEPVDVYRGSDERSMAADNTSGFNCRNAVAPGPKSWSVHAYGEAIDVNPVENPYLEGGKVRPAAGAAFTDRTKLRPGMAVRGGALVQSFALAGWEWGGRWAASRDYQHFSANGR